MNKTLLLIILTLLPMTAWAQTDPEATQEDAPIAAPLLAPPPAKGPTTPTVHSQYAVLVDAATGKILWARNPDTPRQIASTTKIMTAILLIERGRLEDIVTAPPGINTLPESSLHLKPGEKILLRDLLYAMLLRSANDTAVAGADYLCGSVPAFVAQMNIRAKQLGTTHTHFVTPNGLYAPGHCSTASDLAKMAAYAVNNLPLFNTIVKTQKYEVTRSIDKKDRWVRNTASSYLKFFPGADGIKTGYIHQAGHCFVGSATRAGMDGRPWRLIAVALNSGTCREDVMSLLNYGFANFQPTLAVRKGTPLGTVAVASAAAPVPVVAAKDVWVVTSKWHAAPMFQVRVKSLVPAPAAPVTAGTKVGTAVVLAGKKPQAMGDAVAARNVAMAPAAAFVKTSKHIGRIVLPIMGALFAAALVVILGVIIYARTAAEKQRRRKALARKGVAFQPTGTSAEVAGPGGSRLPPDV